MKFLADVNIPQSIITSLRKTGHDVLDIKKINIELKDTEIINLAEKENRIILTRDKDFISLTQFPKFQAATIAIRLKIQTPQYILEHLVELLKNQDEYVLNNSLTIIREDSANSHPF